MERPPRIELAVKPWQGQQSTSKTQEMAAFSTFLRFLKWKMDGKWKIETGFIKCFWKA
jgi:hypothetical protein